ncbi:flagellar hook-length control protein FliK [Acetoanaerobium noterae]|uniref:flagellar hook-length control protein FliK n=1 Tax=Acetoanaerobium noterae TaxID=745369 RepID=UPI0028AD4C3A|nr:flagellar hook-length control protein FliK [Acetoanaerobium noterae]
MNKVDTVSLINMILPKLDSSKGSWGDSAFKDIFSINNSSNSKSNNKPNKSTKDIYSDSQNVDKNLQASKRKDFKSESHIKPKEAKDKLQNDSISNNKHNEKQMSETENASSVSPAAGPNNNEAEASGLIEPEVTINDQANQNPVDIPEKITELIQSLMSANLNPEQLDKVTEAIKILPEEIKAMIQENPKMALDFLKDNLNFLAKTIDLSKEQLTSIENSLTALLEKVGASEDINLDKLINLQKTQIQNNNLNIKAEPKKEVATVDLTDINVELNALKAQPNVVSQQSSMSSNVFSDSQSENLEFMQTDKIEGFDLTGGKIFSNTMLMNSVKKVDVRNNQFMQMISKIADEIRLNVDKNKNEMTIKLQPETLGKLTVKISSENGVMNASFFAENDKAKNMIENNMIELKNSLEKQGIQVQNLTVTVDQNQDELSKHRNIMEAQKYNKAQISVAEFELLEKNNIDNPYVLEDIFSELI